MYDHPVLVLLFTALNTALNLAILVYSHHTHADVHELGSR
jgi:hypothetical protein